MILTLAVPVFDDAEALISTLESLDSACNNTSTEIEILVSDNHSSDESFQVAHSFLAGNHNARVIRQARNIGFEGNLKALDREARGDYIWFIGAGDTISPSILTNLIHFLRSDTPQWVTLHGEFNFHSKNPGPELLEPTTITSSDKTSNSPVYNHALALNIFRRSDNWHQASFPFDAEVISDHPASADPLTLWETERRFWPHLERVNHILRNSKGGVKWGYVSTVAVYLNSNKNGNWDKGPTAMRIFSQWSSVVRETKSLLPRSIWISELSRNLNSIHLLRFVFMLRKEAILPFSEIRRGIAGMDLKVPYLLAALMIASSPSWVAKFLALARNYRNNA